MDAVDPRAEEHMCSFKRITNHQAGHDGSVDSLSSVSMCPLRAEFDYQ